MGGGGGGGGGGGDNGAFPYVVLGRGGKELAGRD